MNFYCTETGFCLPIQTASMCDNYGLTVINVQEQNVIFDADSPDQPE